MMFRVNFVQKRLRLSCKMDECKPLAVGGGEGWTSARAAEQQQRMMEHQQQQPAAAAAAAAAVAVRSSHLSQHH